MCALEIGEAEVDANTRVEKRAKLAISIEPLDAGVVLRAGPRRHVEPDRLSQCCNDHLGDERGSPMACASQLRETQTPVGFDEHGPRAAAVVSRKHPACNV